jgi:hypothetical protein
MIGRKSLPLAFAAALFLAPTAPATTLLSLGASAGNLTANFNDASGMLGNSYAEGGITFTGSSLSSTTFPLVFNFEGNFPSGWSGYNQSPGLLTGGSSWLTIGANGAAMSSFSFQYGNDWNQMAIEYGLFSPLFQWQTLRNGEITGSGSMATGLNFGMYFNLAGDTFDTVNLRSIAAPYGDANHLGLDNVTVQTAPIVLGESAAVPDASAGLILCFVATCAGLDMARRRLRRRLG